ncbi:MAG: hypothetical protein NVS3B20_11730 [Polyangiales bacterium]
MRKTHEKGATVPSGASSAGRLKSAIRRREVVASATKCLERALKAKSPALRAKHAREGLVAICDVETQGLLLRQLYLGELEEGHFEQARTAATQLVSLGVLHDVAHHDAARACQALGDYDGAVSHLESALRVCPEDRRSFHLSTLGGLLYCIGRAAEAIAPLETAVEAAGDAAVPLLRGQLALAQHHAHGDRAELDYAYHQLLRDPTGEGYGRFVLGELARAREDRLSARLHLEAFLAKVRRSRPAARAALSPEVARATATLGQSVWN